MAFKLQYLDKVPQDGNYFSDYGTWAHQLLEQYAKDQIPVYALAEAYEDGYDSAVTHKPPPFPKGMAEKYYQAGLEYFESFDGFGDEWEIAQVDGKPAVECRFEINIGGYPFVGVADLVLRHKETGALRVVDHKSKSKNSMNKEIDTYRRQLYVYAAFVKEKFGVFPEILSFNMFKEGYFIDEYFNIDAYNETMEWIVDTIESIFLESDWKVSGSSYFCRFICSVLDHCPAKNAILYDNYRKGEK